MALLKGKGRSRGGSLVEVQFAILPVIPSAEEPRHAYEVTIGPSSEGRYTSCRIDVAGWQYGHSAVRFAAKMFQDVKALNICPDLQSAEPAGLGLYWNLDWAQIFLVRWGMRKRPSDIQVLVYLNAVECIDGEACNRLGDECLRFVLATTIAEANSFGDELMQEVVAAHTRRRELGISTVDDGDWE